jgi:hypothetical protein
MYTSPTANDAYSPAVTALKPTATLGLTAAVITATRRVDQVILTCDLIRIAASLNPTVARHAALEVDSASQRRCGLTIRSTRIKPH